MNVLLEEARLLYKLAQRDARAFEGLLSVCPPEDFPVAAFHAQQAVEKCLKAALTLGGVVFRRTHDLQALAEIALNSKISLPVDDYILLRLTPYAVEFSYDDTAMPLIEAEQARQAVTVVLAWCAELVGMA